MLAVLLLGSGLGPLPPRELLLLAVSGLIGISLGDTAWFASLRALGPRKALLLSTLAPPLTFLIALFVLDEGLSARSLLGSAITLGGVFWVITEETTATRYRGSIWRGLGWGFLAALAQAIGTILSRSVLSQSEVLPLTSAALRLGAGMLGLLPLVLLRHGVRISLREYKPLLVLVIPATIIGTFLALWLQQVALEQAPAGLVQTLLATSPVFVLPMLALRGEGVSLRALAGALLACGGVALLLGF